MPSRRLYHLNETVRLQDLTATQYNGLVGVVISARAADGRYQVKVTTDMNDVRHSWTNKVFKIKPDNMAFLAPQPGRGRGGST